MKNNIIVELVCFIIGFMMLSMLVAFFNSYALSIWLGFNVMLAIIPWILITLAYKRLQGNEFAFEWLSILYLVAFLFFFPNTFYIITDFIHLDFREFYNSFQYGGTVYTENIAPYLLLVHLIFSVLIGIVAAIKSLSLVELIMKNRQVSTSTINYLIFVILLLSSIGIYIGRFLRLFSWDILNPFYVISQLFDSLTVFSILFILLFFFAQLGIFYGYKLLINKEFTN